MISISSEPRIYVLKSDRDDILEKKAMKIAEAQGVKFKDVFDYLKNRVTKWHLAPIKTTEQANLTAGYLKARTVNEDGDDDWDPTKFKEVDFVQFKGVVKKVENYQVSEDNPKFYKDGFRNFEGLDAIKAVFDDLPGNVATELVQAAASDKLGDEDLINLDFKSILNSGDKKK